MSVHFISGEAVAIQALEPLFEDRRLSAEEALAALVDCVAQRWTDPSIQARVRGVLKRAYAQVMNVAPKYVKCFGLHVARLCNPDLPSGLLAEEDERIIKALDTDGVPGLSLSCEHVRAQVRASMN
jgi:hypothetical protein